MSIKDITDYVRLTPGNTNPSVIGSMVQSEVNGTLKESKAYTDQEVGNLKNSGGAGYVTPSKVVTFDGDITGKTSFEISGVTYVRVADAPLDIDNIVSAIVTSGGVKVEIGASEITYAKLGDVVGFEANGAIGGLYYPTDAGEVKAGLYFAYYPAGETFTEETYASKVEFAETIHAIDPKFIPGAVLPVVELETVYPFGQSGTTVDLSADDAARLETAAKSGMPIVVVCPAIMDEVSMTLTVLCSLVATGDMKRYDGMIMENTICFVTNGGGVWTAGD